MRGRTLLVLVGSVRVSLRLREGRSGSKVMWEEGI
jgi:hypothetical protein